MASNDVSLKLRLDSTGVSKGLAGITSSLKSLATTMGIAFSAKAIFDFGKKSVDLASDLTESQNVVDVTFGKMSSQINDFASNCLQSFGLSELSAKQFTGTLGGMISASGITGQALTDMSINLTKLSADMASFYNLDMTTMLEKMRSGLAGQVMPLRQVGINMTIANLNAFAMSQGITKAYKSMSQSEQVILRYNYLMAVTANAQGDFVRTSGTFANQARLLKENFMQLGIVLGTYVLPMITPVVQMLNQMILTITEVIKSLAQLNGMTSSLTPSGGVSASAETKQLSLPTDQPAGLSPEEAMQDMDYSDLTDSATQASQAEDKLGKSVAKAGKEAKNSLASFDELNVMQDNSGSGVGAEDAPAGLKLNTPAGYTTDMSAKTEGLGTEMAKTLQDKLKDAFKPITDAWAVAGKGVLDSIHYALTQIKGLIDSIGESFKKIWENGSGKVLIESYLLLFQEIMLIIGDIAKAFKEAWNSDGKGDQVVQSLFNMLTSINVLLVTVGESFRAVWNNGTGVIICTEILNILKNTMDIVTSIASSFTTAWESGNLGQTIVQNIMTTLANVLLLIDEMGVSFLNVWNNGTGVITCTDILTILKGVTGTIAEISGQFAKAWETGNAGTIMIQNIMSGIDNVLALIGTIATGFQTTWATVGQGVADTFMKMGDDISLVFTNVTALILGVWTNGGQTLFDNLVIIGAKIIEIGGYVIDRFITPFVNGLINTLQPPLEAIMGKVGELSTKVADFMTWLSSNKGVIDVIVIVLGSMATAYGLVTLAMSAGSIATSAWSVVCGIASAATSVFAGAMAILTSPITLIVVAIGAVIAVGVLLYQNWDYISAKASEVWGGICNYFSGIGKSISDTFNGVIDYLSGAFTSGFQSAFNGISSFFSGIWEGMKNMAKDPLNYMIDMVNNVIDGINSLTIPDWVPVIGGGKANIPKIPKLANGGVIPPNNEFLAVLGDQKSGTNIETPLSTMVDAFRTALAGVNMGGQVPELTIMLDGDALDHKIVNTVESNNKRGGGQ